MNRSLLLRVFCIKTFLFQLIICFSTFTSAQNQQDGFFYCRVVSYSQVVSTNVETAKQRISKLVYETDQSLYNSIIFVIPQQVLFSKTKDDVLEFAINEAKKYNLKFFVVVDLLKVFSETKKEWLCKKQNGEIFIPYYLCCGNPEVHSYVRGVVKSFVSIYQIDGIIFENLGYPSKDCSYDSVSLNRFYTRGNLKTLSYEDFQQEQVTKLLTDLYAEIKNYNKNLLVGVFVKDIYKNSSQLKGSYYENFQDVKLWVETNRCDFVVAELKPENIKLQLNDFLKTYPSNKLMFYTQNLIQVEKVFDTVLSRQLFGIVLSSTQAYKLNTKPAFPKVDFNTNIIMGKIQDDNNIGLNDAWISVISEGNEITKTFSSYDGFFSFVNITTQPVNLEFFYPYCKKVIISSITVKENEIKLLEPIIIEGSSEERKKLPLIILRPKDLVSQKPVLHILARTLPENKVEFFSEQTSAKTKVYPTGIFAIDNVKLKLGENLFKFVITDSLGKISSTYFLTISYTTSEVKGIKSVEKEFEVILPKENLMLFTGDVLELKFRGPAKKKIYAVCFDNNEKLFLEEIADGVYYKRYLIPENFSSQSTKLKVCYDYIEQKKYFWGKQKIKTKIFETDVYIEVWNSAYPLIAETNSTKTPLTYGLHYVRLGGPYITELPKGIKLHIVGKQQDKFKVKLSASLSGWVEEKNVNLIRNKENKIPQNYFTSCSVSTTDVFDQIIIPWKEQTAFSLSSLLEDEKLYLIVDFFNTHLATTWIINNPKAKTIKNINITQLEDGWVRMKIELKQNHLWGFWANATGSNLTINIKHPPKINSENPIKGIKIALEAGHGGEGNTGALGLSGSKEKNINLAAVEILAKVFEQSGAKVIIMRQGDTNPSFDERLKIAYDNSADLIISLHANAGNIENGYLNSPTGPSVFYKHEHCKVFAEIVYGELINLWGRGEGVVKNFNYAIVRQTTVPAILVEMGYLTHPEDEAKLLNKEVLTKQAERIVSGTKKFLSTIK